MPVSGPPLARRPGGAIAELRFARIRPGRSLRASCATPSRRSAHAELTMRRMGLLALAFAAVSSLAVPAGSRATTGAAAATVGESFFGGSVPVNPPAASAVATEVGLRFRANVAGSVTAIRFYKGPSNTGTHVGTLWDSSGRKITSVVFTNETASGWQQANIPLAARLTAGGSYVVSYLAPAGHYAADERAFGSGVSTTSLYAYSKKQGRNGVYRYGAGFPTRSH